MVRGEGCLGLERTMTPAGVKFFLKFLKKILKTRYKIINLAPIQLACKLYI